MNSQIRNNFLNIVEKYNWLTEEDLNGQFINTPIRNKIYIRTFKDDELRQYINVKTYPCKIIKKIRAEKVEGKVNGNIDGSSYSSGYSYSSGFAYNGIGSLGGSGYSSGYGSLSGSLNGKLNTNTHFTFVLDINNGMMFDELEVSADDYYRYNENDIIYCKLYAYTEVHRNFIPSEIKEVEEKEANQQEIDRQIEQKKLSEYQVSANQINSNDKVDTDKLTLVTLCIVTFGLYGIVHLIKKCKNKNNE